MNIQDWGGSGFGPAPIKAEGEPTGYPQVERRQGMRWLRGYLLFAAAVAAFLLGMMIASFFLPAQAAEPCAANTVPPPEVSRAADPMPEILYETADVLFDVCMAGEHVYGCADTVHNKLYLWAGLTPDQSACVLEHELAHFPPGNWVH